MSEPTQGSPAPVLLTFTAYAAHRKVTQGRVSQLVAERRIPIVELDGKRWIDPAAADAALALTADPSQKAKGPPASRPADPGRVAGGPVAPAPLSGSGEGNAAGPVQSPPGPAGGALGSYADARTATERLRAKMLDVEYRQKSGALVESAKVADAVRDASLAAAKILDAFPDRYAGPFAAESDVRKMRALLLAAVDDVKRSIAGFAEATADAKTETRQ